MEVSRRLLPSFRSFGGALLVPRFCGIVNSSPRYWTLQRRLLQTSSKPVDASINVPDFAFAFDIDGVLLRSSKPIARANRALSYLQQHQIPFILLTNGGGKHETERIAELSEKLNISLDTQLIVQSHTPFAEFATAGAGQKDLRDKCILVVGGDGNKCRQVAQKYGFKNIVTPGDVYAAYPAIWPFSNNFVDYYKSFAKPLPKPIVPEDLSNSLKIDAIFVYNDPRDWALDTQVIVDLLLSHQGFFGTTSPLNNNVDRPNKGYQQDGQPKIYFSNPDLWWAASYHLPRLGQGGFREALEGVWAAVTGGPKEGVELKKTIIGKPTHTTYDFAEKRLNHYRWHALGQKNAPLKRVFMVGDNPDSDIRGANQYKSHYGSDWISILVKTGVYQGQETAWKPRAIAEDVWAAVQWAVKTAGWQAPSD